MYLNKLKTTTWSERNTDKMNVLKEHILEQSADVLSTKLDFLIVGPGGITKSFSKELSTRDETFFGKVKYLLIRQIEALLRKTGFFELEVFEIDDFMKVFGQTNLANKIYVSDIEEKVLESVRNKYGDEVKTIRVDISNQSIGSYFDVIICYNVLQRIDNLDNGLDNLITSLRPGGLFSVKMNDDSSLESKLGKLGLEKIDNHLYKVI